MGAIKDVEIRERKRTALTRTLSRYSGWYEHSLETLIKVRALLLKDTQRMVRVHGVKENECEVDQRPPRSERFVDGEGG